MKIFIMRHGEAEMMAQSDKARKLTDNGQRQAITQGTWLKSIAPELDKVLVSPYSRALETFEYINQSYDNRLIEKHEIWDAITPYGNPELVSDYLAVLADQNAQTVLLISHLPLVGEIITELCGRNPIGFYPSTIVEVDWDTERGSIIQYKSA